MTLTETATLTAYRTQYQLQTVCTLKHLIHINTASHSLVNSVTTVTQTSAQRGLRSSNIAEPVKPRNRMKFGECGFWTAKLDTWNRLPLHLHCFNADSILLSIHKDQINRKTSKRVEEIKKKYVPPCRAGLGTTGGRGVGHAISIGNLTGH